MEEVKLDFSKIFSFLITSEEKIILLKNSFEKYYLPKERVGGFNNEGYFIATPKEAIRYVLLKCAVEEVEKETKPEVKSVGKRNILEFRIKKSKIINPLLGAGWFHPSDIYFLNISSEDKKIIERVFRLDGKRFLRATV
jgi:hypothetical protein